MNTKLTSWVRTVVPGLWSAVVAWLVTLGLPEAVTDAAAGLGDAVVYPLALAAVYALLRWAEQHMPAWLTRALLGSAKTPAYPESPPPPRPPTPPPAWPVEVLE